MTWPLSPTGSACIFSNKDTRPLISNEELNTIIIQLETDIEDGSWHQNNYSKIDMKFLPVLVEQANNRFPEMNLTFVRVPGALSVEINNVIEQKVESSRFIVNVGESGIHFCVIDCKYINGKTSLILFEPVNFNVLTAALLAGRVRAALELAGLSDCHLSLAALDIQRSFSECGIFSLALAKKLYKESDVLLKMHEDNIHGTLIVSEMRLPHYNLDPYLPVTFFKHCQSIRRLDEYLDTNPDGVGTVINKKNDTIRIRFNNNQSEGKSVSVHKKRVTELKKLNDPG